MLDRNEVVYSFDRILTAKIADNKPFKFISGKIVELVKTVLRSQKMLNAVKVSKKNFSTVHTVAREFSGKAGIALPDIFIESENELNAWTYGTENESFIVMTSRLVDSFSEEELRFVIGHEIGHIAAGHVLIRQVLSVLDNKFVVGFMPAYWARLAVGTLIKLSLRKWERISEFSADRYGYLCTEDKNVSLRALARLQIGLMHHHELDIDEFLKQYSEIRDSWLTKLQDSQDNLFSSHSSVFRRIIALQMFCDNWKTQVLIPSDLDDKIKAILNGAHLLIGDINEAYEQLLIQSLLYVAQADGKLSKKESSFITELCDELEISEKVKNDMLYQQGADMLIEKVSIMNNLNPAQKEKLLDSLCEVAVIDGSYAAETDSRLKKLLEKHGFQSRIIADRRAGLIKKHGNTSLIADLIQ